MILALVVKQLRVSTEITNNETKNIIFNVVYRPPDGDIDVCETFKNILFKENLVNKNILLAVDFKCIPTSF